MTLQGYDPKGTVCTGNGILNFTRFGLSVGFNITGCGNSISLRSDTTTFTAVCNGVITNTIGVNSRDDMFYYRFKF